MCTTTGLPGRVVEGCREWWSFAPRTGRNRLRFRCLNPESKDLYICVCTAYGNILLSSEVAGKIMSKSMWQTFNRNSTTGHSENKRRTDWPHTDTLKFCLPTISPHMSPYVTNPNHTGHAYQVFPKLVILCSQGTILLALR